MSPLTTLAVTFYQPRYTWFRILELVASCDLLPLHLCVSVQEAVCSNIALFRIVQPHHHTVVTETLIAQNESFRALRAGKHPICLTPEDPPCVIGKNIPLQPRAQ